MTDENPATARTSEPMTSWALTMQALKHTRLVSGSNKQVVDAGLLGVCVLFLDAMLGLPHLDTLLQLAVLDFACAIPLLILGFVWASHEVEPVPGMPLVQAQAIIAAVLGAIGEGAAGVGMLAVFGHLSHAAVIVLLATVGFIFLAMIVGPSGGLFVYAIHKVRSGENPESLAHLFSMGRHGSPDARQRRSDEMHRVVRAEPNGGQSDMGAQQEPPHE
jgi:hypothetical protein